MRYELASVSEASVSEASFTTVSPADTPVVSSHAGSITAGYRGCECAYGDSTDRLVLSALDYQRIEMCRFHFVASILGYKVSFNSKKKFLLGF